MRLKTDGNWMVDVTEKGYEIRPFGRNGSIVIVDYDLNIKISSSHTTTFSLSKFDKLRAEILNGIMYIKQHPVYEQAKPVKLKLSQITELSYYRDIRGRGVFEMGKAAITKNITFGFSTNRAGCPYVTGYIRNYEDVQLIQSKFVGTEFVINIMVKPDSAGMNFDSRANKNNSLLERLWVCDQTPLQQGQKITVYVNNKQVLQCEKEL